MPAIAEYLHPSRWSQSNRILSWGKNNKSHNYMGRIVCSHRLGVNFVKWLPCCLGRTSVSATLFVLRCFGGKGPGDLSQGGLLVSRSQFVTRSKGSIVSRAWVTLWNLQVYLILRSASMFEPYCKVIFSELNFINVLILSIGSGPWSFNSWSKLKWCHAMNLFISYECFCDIIISVLWQLFFPI